MQPTTKRLCLYSEYSNYKTCFYTCKAAEKNKIIFYPTTQNPSILRSSRNTNYTLHNTSNFKLYLKTSNVPFLKSSTETNSPSLEVFRPKQIKTQETWSQFRVGPILRRLDQRSPEIISSLNCPYNCSHGLHANCCEPCVLCL